LKFVVTEAARHNLPVAAHAHSTESIKAVVEAGVAFIEHASFISDDGIRADDRIIRLLAERKTVVVPTNIPAVNAVRAGRTLGLARELSMASSDFLARREEVMRTLRAGGVRLIAGTDAGATGVHFTDVFGEIELLAQAGMNNAQAVAAATGDSAECLGLHDVGRIAPRQFADLVAVRGDPAANLTALRNPLLVILGGTIVREERQ